ncbi:L-tyrosine 3-hydroxylase [Amycolatopsis speibonae]|uniref:L-tyrosine 3-hydroxylase n=1 Tax=Amycolatopsis speibonae TaxID=1450224 RepID=A0ABV7PA90_9PSEU
MNARESGRLDVADLYVSMSGELFDTYSALLLYGGSLSPEIYQGLVRPRMMAAHTAFSGLWSRDYSAVHAQTKKLESSFGLGVELKNSIKFNRLVHMSLANRLVPDGPSLRRQAGYVNTVATRDEEDILDEFFRTRRMRICRHEFTRQLRGRNELVLADLAESPITVSYGRASVDRFQGAIGSRLERFAVIAGKVARTA